LEISTKSFARARLSGRVWRKAPSPVFKSKTTPAVPVANFLERILAMIKGRESTVAVTSRRP
jgi:hypothetical protein